MTPSEVEALPVTVFSAMWDDITTIEAQEMLKAIKVANFNNMEKNDRERLHRDLMQTAYPDAMKAKKLSLTDLQGLLANR